MAERGDGVKRLWHGQARRFALWIPVCMGIGIWMRFGGETEAAWGVLVLCIAFLALRYVRPFLGVLAVLCGFAAAEIRIGLVDAPVLPEEYRGMVEGRVVVQDRSRSGAPRVTLSDVRLTDVGPRVAVPERVRLSLVRSDAVPLIGDILRVRAVIAPPPGPPEPGAFDFSRQAYFLRIGGVGYALGKPETRRAEGAAGFGVSVNRVRARISEAVRLRIGGERGAVAAALIVGDRSAISEETRDALRDSGLAHLLAISGLHMGLLSALVFWSVRLGLALVPGLAERVAIRKYAAVTGLMAAAVYLVMSGASVATQRAFVMTSVVFVAMLLDRTAVTMRGLAAAAVLILAVRPESLFQAGFQMSFGAVVALVAAYEATRGFWRGRAERRDWLARLWTAFLATVMTSTVAGLATAPFAAYHFNRLVIWGLPANLLATPLMGLWIMPCVILAAVLAPVGLAGWGLSLLGAGIGFVLFVAEYFSGIDGAVAGVAAGMPAALGAVVMGGLWLAIWRGWPRLLGVIPMLAGLGVWEVPRPDLIVSRGAGLIAGRGEDGRLWISRARADAYAAEMWLRRDGEATRDRAAAWKRREWRCTKRRCRGWTGDDWRVVFLRNGPAGTRDCAARTILIAPHLSQNEIENGECFVLAAEQFDGASALAVAFPTGQRPLVVSARPWRALSRQ